MKLARVTVVEMRRALRRELVRWMIALALVLCAFAGFVAFWSSRGPKAVPVDHPARMVEWWTPGSSEGFLTLAALFLVVGAGICGASVAGAEWKAGTVTTTLTWEPSRLRLHGARTLSAAALAFLIGFALQVVFLASALPAVIAHGSTTGTDAAWWWSLVLAMFRISLVTSLVATLAVSIATLGRNTSAALVAIAGWTLVVERVVAGLKPQLARFLVAENVATVVPWAPLEDAKFHRPPIVSLVSLLVYLGVIVGAATWAFQRRDIVAAS